jgi:hypothetical protein
VRIKRWLEPVSIDLSEWCPRLPPSAEPEIFDFPGGIGPCEVVNVEHEEVVMISRFIPKANRVRLICVLFLLRIVVLLLPLL